MWLKGFDMRIVTLNGSEMVPQRDYHFAGSDFPIFHFRIKGGRTPDVLGITTVERGIITGRVFYEPSGEIASDQQGYWFRLNEESADAPALSLVEVPEEEAPSATTAWDLIWND